MTTLRESVEKLKLPTEAESRECDAAWALYLERGHGAPLCAAETFRAAWLFRAALQAQPQKPDEAQPPEPQYKAALNRAAYALFQIKRMAPEAIVEFAKAEHGAACKVLDGEPPEPPKE